MNELQIFLADIFYPRRCLGCQKLIFELSESHLCSYCLATIEMKKDFICAFCDSPTILGKTCPFCRKRHYLDQLLTASDYKNLQIQKMVKGLKYRFLASLALDIGNFMAKYFKEKIGHRLNSEDLLVTAVPLHRKRLNWRGYNQSELIAQKIIEFFGWHYDKILDKKSQRPPQADIKDRQIRIQNANAAFVCKKPELVQGKTILVIDDVSTTGSTLDDCARALKGAGAREVIGFVFAR